MNEIKNQNLVQGDYNTIVPINNSLVLKSSLIKEQSLFLQRELIEQNKRIISLLEQLNNTVNKDNATNKNAIEGGESPFDILETQ